MTIGVVLFAIVVLWLIRCAVKNGVESAIKRNRSGGSRRWP